MSGRPRIFPAAMPPAVRAAFAGLPDPDPADTLPPWPTSIFDLVQQLVDHRTVTKGPAPTEIRMSLLARRCFLLALVQQRRDERARRCDDPDAIRQAGIPVTLDTGLDGFTIRLEP